MIRRLIAISNDEKLSTQMTILQLIKEYIPQALSDIDTNVENDDHFMASIFVAHYKDCIDAHDERGMENCLLMANDPRLYSDESAKEAMETTAFISIFDEGLAYSEPFVSMLASDARKAYERTVAIWNTRP